MDLKEFLVQGSSESPYQVVFKKVGSKFSAHCSCPAGQNGQFCKHRSRIMASSSEDVISGNEVEIPIVVSWIKGTNVEANLAEISRLEIELEKTKSALAKAKKALAKSLN